MVFAAAVTFGAATGSASWEYGEPETEAGTSPAAIGGILEQFPSSLYPEVPADRHDDMGKQDANGTALVRLQQGTTPEPVTVRPLHPQELFGLPPFSPTLVPTVSVVEAASARISQQGGSLTESEMRHVLAEAGWPEALFSEALAVAWCESKWSPYALGDSGRSAGLFQLNLQTWFPYAKEDAERWADPLVNARVAWATYQYDIGRGYEPWRQWSCKPT